MSRDAALREVSLSFPGYEAYAYTIHDPQTPCVVLAMEGWPRHQVVAYARGMTFEDAIAKAKR